MNQEFAKLDRFKFMLHVLKLAYVFDPKLALIPVDHCVSEELCVGHIKNSLSDRLYDLYAPVMSALELKYKAYEEGSNKYLLSKYLEFQMINDKPIMKQVHELQAMVNKLNALSISIPKLFQVGAIIAKLPPSLKDFSKRMIHRSVDYSLDDLMKHLRIEDETHIRYKRGKVRSRVHHVSIGGSGHKTKYGEQNKRNLGPKKQTFKKPSHQNPNSKPKRVRPCYVYGEIGHYARECKDRKLGPITHTVEQVTNMVASVNLGEILMIFSLTRAICARGLFVDIRSIMHICGQRESFRTCRPMPLRTVVVCVDSHRVEVQEEVMFV
uniref:CCHC-type domain-containing protein n=1 Tax=Lactuca sativa TaxID=4236 RepID=A0A9R1VQL8_LACSA|nr:hypothetical protein LSAT_V11C400170410 [Lactuca sativa]